MVFAFLGPTEVVVILIIALLVFGPQKLPEIGKQIGSAYRELNRMRSEVTRALEFDSYVQPYDMPPYETPAEGTTYARDGYGHSAYENDYVSLHNALAVPPPGPSLSPTVTMRPVDENTVVDAPAPLEASTAGETVGVVMPAPVSAAAGEPSAVVTAGTTAEPKVA